MTAVNQGAGDDYLSLYRRLLAARRLQHGAMDKTEDALNQLGAVRLFLAQYFARCAVTGRPGIAVA